MKFQLLINNKPVDLPTKLSLKIDYKSPIFNDMGTRSLPFNLPATNFNNELFNFPANRHSTDKNNSDFDYEILFEKVSLLKGTLTIIDVNETQIHCYLKAGMADFAYLTKSMKITDLNIKEKMSNSHQADNDFVAMMDDNVTSYTKDNHFTFFPVYSPDFTAKDENDYRLGSYPFSDILNMWDSNIRHVADYYENCFMRHSMDFIFKYNQKAPSYLLSYVIMQLFKYLGYSIKKNIFYDDDNLNNIVILNFNNSDNKYPDYPDELNSCDEGSYDYYQILGQYICFKYNLPEILIADFVKALENRFFVRFIINDTKRTVNIIKLKDIIISTKYVEIKSNPYYKKTKNEITNICVKFSKNTELNSNFTVVAKVDSFSDIKDLKINMKVSNLVLIRDESYYYQLILNSDNNPEFVRYKPNFIPYNSHEQNTENTLTLESNSITLEMYDMKTITETSTWKPNTQISKDTAVKPSTSPEWPGEFDYKYIATNDGTTGDTEPQWNTLIDNYYYGVHDDARYQTEDNDVIWKQALLWNDQVLTYLPYLEEQRSQYHYNLPEIGTYLGGKNSVQTYMLKSKLNEEKKTNNLILLKYYGLITINVENTERKYPFASSNNYMINSDGTYCKINNMSLLNDGEDGIIETLGKEYIHWRLNTHQETRKLYFDLSDLINFDWTLKRRVDHVNYLVDKFSVTFHHNSFEISKAEIWKC